LRFFQNIVFGEIYTRTSHGAKSNLATRATTFNEEIDERRQTVHSRRSVKTAGRLVILAG
jgi:hypothetical protein